MVVYKDDRLRLLRGIAATFWTDVQLVSAHHILEVDIYMCFPFPQLVKEDISHYSFCFVSRHT